MSSADRRRSRRAERDGLARRHPAAAAPARPAEAAASPVIEPAKPLRRPHPPNARRVALDVLDATLGPQRRAFDQAFDSHPKLQRLSQRDRAFARVLVATALRRLGQLDRVLAPLLRRRPKELSVENMLRLGAAQLLFLGTPAHAAVGETVRLAAGRFPRQAPLVNAVLRKVATQGRAAVEDQDEARLNTPRWLWDSWVAAFGEARARAVAEAHLHEPPLDLRPIRDAARWADELNAELLPTGALRRRAGGLVETLPGFEEGAWWVQDAAAGLPVILMGELKGQQVADLCAAPGGKTAQLCAAGAKVTAVERSPKRVEYLAGNLARLGFTPEILAVDLLEWEPSELFDAVLLDAPCTATGTIRRHPDVLWSKSPDDVRRLAEVQLRLLLRAARIVRPGGLLVYAVCSLQPEEGEHVVAAALAEGGLARVPVRRPELQGLEAVIDAEGQVRTLPCGLAGSGGLDGFFIARLRREAA
jgi:16S rRNA (cytosine967-C5)-methyltransferase